MLKSLETERYLLRKPKMGDAKDIYEKWGKDTERVAEYQAHDVYKSVAETRAILRSSIIDAENGAPVWFVEDKIINTIIGYAKVTAISQKNKECEIAFYFVKKCRNDYSPEEVLKVIVKHLLFEEGYETVITNFFDRSKEDTEYLTNVLEGIGMKREGILRNRMINSKGEKINKIVYSILKEEWGNIAV